MNGIQDCQRYESVLSVNPLIGIEKRCTKCGIAKGLEDFYSQKGGRYGKKPHCKKCFDKDTKMRVLKDPLKVRTEKQKYHAAHKEAISKRKKINHIKNHSISLMRLSDYRRLHPERGPAVQKLRNAILRGRIIRPTICTKCGTIGPVDGHHENYDKPLDVMWLCRSCHLILHRERSEQHV